MDVDTETTDDFFTDSLITSFGNMGVEPKVYPQNVIDALSRTEPHMNKCIECYANHWNAGVQTLCVKCIQKPCSVCEQTGLPTNISDWSGRPICQPCKQYQCYLCGGQCATHDTPEGYKICEDCGKHWCNTCEYYDGSCCNACPDCGQPCDSEARCGCVFECKQCAQPFVFEGKQPHFNDREQELCMLCFQE
jgi:hypothetical protein